MRRTVSSTKNQDPWPLYYKQSLRPGSSSFPSGPRLGVQWRPRAYGDGLERTHHTKEEKRPTTFRVGGAHIQGLKRQRYGSLIYWIRKETTYMPQDSFSRFFHPSLYIIKMPVIRSMTHSSKSSPTGANMDTRPPHSIAAQCRSGEP